MTEENLHLLENLYQQYKNPIKPLLAEIEAVYEKFPLPLFNEIRAMNDHIARAFVTTDDDKAREQINKAGNHVDRIIRDCYKFLNVYYREEAEKFDKDISSVEPRSKADYRRMAEYGELSDNATNLVEIAKSNEHLVSKDKIYVNFENSYNAYKDLHRFIVKNRRDIIMMRRKKKLKAIGTTLLSVFTFILGCIITNNNAAIIKVLQDLIGLFG